MPAVKINQEIADFTVALEALSTPERAAGEKRYLKSDLHHLGAPVPAIRKTARKWLRAHPDLGREDLLRLARALFRRRVHELRGIATHLLMQRESLLEARDVELLEDLLRRSKTWVHVDNLSAHVVGPLFERCPELGRTLDRWAEDEDFWIRRSSMLALLLALRRGEGDWNRFVRYADGMLEEKEFFIRKAIGWVLRETAKVNPERVEEYLAARLDRVSGLTLREGAKYLPEKARRRLLP